MPWVVRLLGLDVEEFEYESEDEARDGFRRLQDSCRRQFAQDGAHRTLVLENSQYEEWSTLHPY